MSALRPDVYFVTVRSRSKTSDSLIVNLRQPPRMPIVDFLFDGHLYFSTIAGEPSEGAEILVHIENIDAMSISASTSLLSYRSSTVRRGSSLSQPRRKPHIYATQRCLPEHSKAPSRHRKCKRQQHRERYRRLLEAGFITRTSRPPGTPASSILYTSTYNGRCRAVWNPADVGHYGPIRTKDTTPRWH